MQNRQIHVYADWANMDKPHLLGMLNCIPGRGEEIFSFEYSSSWLESGFSQVLDPSLQLYKGAQYAPESQINFGMFLDSSPDRWGRLLIRRREAELARTEKRSLRKLIESDYLLGVFDLHRHGGLRFKLEDNGDFLDNQKDFATPPWTSLRELEHASLQLEKEGIEKSPQYGKWLRLLINPGTSLGGARPKASVVAKNGDLWIAKFPSRMDTENKGGWEAVSYKLATLCGIKTAPFKAQIFSGKHHTFLTKRFDRAAKGKRIHFASAMTMLQKKDGEDASSGVSYLEIVEFLIRFGAKPKEDLEELWKRIVFFICISNTDDHLRNHGFLLTSQGWILSPCYDMNPSDTGDGLKLNISEDDNSQNLDLTLEVATHFRLSQDKAKKLTKEICKQVKKWKQIAKEFKINSSEQNRMSVAFRVAEQL
ncbi:MAG: type II toxin-antitoxin system HipA family toxin [Leptospiraceae bacterium]|nr:type II toxin-antitoxin system HipA family toxin [Leptospiraceae bacterium]